MSEPQSYAHHRRLHPLFHFVAFPLSVLFLVAQGRALVKAPGWPALMGLLGAVALVLGVFLSRLYALRVQDRLIRLEETLRMRALLPADLQARISELRPGQFVALRFASDAELVDRVREALDGRLGAQEIKRRIQTWRPDTFRV